jgi:hypothetical protein
VQANTRSATAKVEAVELACEGNGARNAERRKDEDERDGFFKNKKHSGGRFVLRFKEKPSNLRTTTLCFSLPPLVSGPLFLSFCLKISLECIDNEVLEKKSHGKRETTYIFCPLSFT